MAKKEASSASTAKKSKHPHPRDAKEDRKVFVPNDFSKHGTDPDFDGFRRRLQRSTNLNRFRDDEEPEDEIDIPPNLRKKRKGKGGADSDDDSSGGISWKYVLLTGLMMAPGVLEMVSMSGGLYPSALALLAWLSSPYHILITILCVAVPVLLYKTLPGRLVTLMFVAVMVSTVTFPSVAVYMCSPVMLNYTHFSTNYSLRLAASDIVTQAAMPCVRRYPFAVYRFAALAPTLSLVVNPGDVVNVNITSSNDSPLPYRLLMVKSGRSVKGQWKLIYLLAKVPRRLAMRDVFTSLLEDKREEASYVIRGKLVDTPKSMKPMQQQLAADKYMRKMMFDVHTIAVFT